MRNSGCSLVNGALYQSAGTVGIRALRILSFLLIGFALVAPVVADEVVIGTGTSFWGLPLSTSYHDARTQVIYLASEVGAAGRIGGLALDVMTKPGEALGNFTIRMKQTPLSSYSPGVWESTGWTVCYQTTTSISTTGWVNFEFTTPFVYDGVSNLMVDFSFNNSSWSSDGYCRYSATSADRTLYYRTNSSYGDPLTWSGSSNPTPSRISGIPNVKLSIGPPAQRPVFNPPGGAYSAPQIVTITCDTAGAVIHYTLNGMDPTESDPVVANGGTVSVPVSPPTTLKARAWAAGFVPSPVTSALYRLPGIVHVSPSGNDSKDGLSWAKAKKTVTAGLGAAYAGEEVWVAGNASHPYAERITLKGGVGLYGGFAGTETSRNQRNWQANVTILDGSGTGDVVEAPSGVTSTAVVDGFTVRNGYFGISCYSSSLTIANNTITNNIEKGASPDGPEQGGYGIYCYSSSPTIMNNTISRNDKHGIYCSGSSPTIAYNTISENSSSGIDCSFSSSPTITNNTIFESNYGIRCSSSSSPTIANNTISWNIDDGIYCSSSSPTIANNTITGNGYTGISCYSSSSPTIANNTIFESNYGIRCSSSSAVITNNTISGNREVGISCSSSTPTITNNIVAFNAKGLDNSSGIPVLNNNCVFNPGGVNYDGLNAGAGDINVDPKLQSAQTGKLHIQPDSPCVDAGLDSAVQPDWKDMDGQARIQGAHVDIGADESDGTVWPEYQPVIVRVSPSGVDDAAHDGSNWALAKRTVQAGVEAASVAGGEVWVAAGTYSEHVVMRASVSLYGGFAGTETSRDERDWTANRTILDGSGTGYVVRGFSPGYFTNVLDGFTVRNGSGGIYCSSSSPAIANMDCQRLYAQFV
ncbi:MAG: right-handed parallel beta-helix repeat-containing protein [Armatimonadetes bacterium]|nr:right-handed parallel beta-helix repeat-containing protein [Armatimonadota bacterium]